MKKILKWIWKILEEPLLENNYFSGGNREKSFHNLSDKEKSWCPYCGYSGTADDLRCHLLNKHKN
jgi:hypothetical protein